MIFYSEQGYFPKNGSYNKGPYAGYLTRTCTIISRYVISTPPEVSYTSYWRIKKHARYRLDSLKWNFIQRVMGREKRE